MEVFVNYDYREADVRALLDVEALVKLVAEAENVPEDAEASVSFVTDEEIHRLNREFRDVDRPTDVLSFECDGVDDDMPVVEGEAFELGDIVIAPDVAEAQAPQYGLSFEDEMSLLVTHGMLHLCGYDHMEDDEAKIMESREQELLSDFWGRPFKRSGADLL